MRKAGDIITALFKERFGEEFIDTARTTSGLFSSWTEVVAEVWPPGPELAKDDIPAAAAHSKIRELEHGLLQIEADHPGWIQLLQTKQSELLSTVQRRYPEMNIRGISFRLSRNPPPGEKKPAHKEQVYELKQEEIHDEVHEEAHNAVDSEERQNTAAPRDEEFYTALKGLEKSIRKRNGL